jgi:hypothetical protein
MKLTNPFWKDVLFSYHFAKPYTKMNTDELLSLDNLNFVPVTDLNYYIRWIEQIGILFTKYVEIYIYIVFLQMIFDVLGNI